MSRGGFKITPHSQDNEDLEVHSEKLSPMISQFAKSVTPQSAVDQARSRNAQSFMQQLTSIMTGKQRYATVDDAVKDMQERTGLTTHLENIKSAKKKVNKQANLESQIPETFTKYDFANDIINYINNNISNSGGGSSIASIQYDLLSVFPKLDASDVMNDEVAKYLNNCIYEKQKMVPSDSGMNQNIGKGVGKDLLVQDSDPWAGLMPSK